MFCQTALQRSYADFLRATIIRIDDMRTIGWIPKSKIKAHISHYSVKWRSELKTVQRICPRAWIAAVAPIFPLLRVEGEVCAHETVYAETTAGDDWHVDGIIFIARNDVISLGWRE